MTPLERAARALENHLICGTVRKGEYKDAVMVVLAAIRKPSNAMVSSGGEIIADVANLGDAGGRAAASEFDADAEGVWRAMIDAMLQEEGMVMDHGIVKQGANARALRRSEFDNPFLRAESCPAATGETVEQWQAKERAWHFGWTAEDATRA